MTLDLVLVIGKPVTGRQAEFFFNHGEKIWIFLVKSCVWLDLRLKWVQVEDQNGLHSVGLDPPRLVGGTGLDLGDQEAGEWPTN